MSYKNHCSYDLVMMAAGSWTPVHARSWFLSLSVYNYTECILYQWTEISMLCSSTPTASADLALMSMLVYGHETLSSDLQTGNKYNEHVKTCGQDNSQIIKEYIPKIVERW